MIEPAQGPGPGPRPLKVSLDRVARVLDIAPGDVLGRVFSHWPDLVGPDVAAHTWPASLRGGVLVVHAEDAPVGSELRYRAHDLLARIAADAGSGAPTRMEVRVRPRRTRRSDPPVVN